MAALKAGPVTAVLVVSVKAVLYVSSLLPVSEYHHV